MAKRINYAALYTLRSDGRYQGWYRDRDGKRHAAYDRDPEQLHRKLQELEKPKALLFRDLAEHWHDAAWETYKDGTQSAYAAAYKRALEELGDREAASIGTPEIFTHLERMAAANYSAKTVKTQRTIYHLIFQAAIADPRIGQEIKLNPAHACPLPKGLPKAKKREAPDDAAVERIRKTAATAYNGLLPLFLMSTGFRRGEALGIQWGDVDFKAKTITCRQAVSQRGGSGHVQSTKTENALRTVPILPDLEPLLIKPRGAKATDFVFAGEDPSKPMSQATYERRWLHYCRDAGFAVDTPEERISKQGKRYTVHHWKPTLTAHMLRHGYATLLFEADVDEFTAQRLLGHADITTTRSIYTHLRQRKQAQSLDKLRSYVARELDRPAASAP